MDITIKAAFIGAMAALIAAVVTVVLGASLEVWRQRREGNRIRVLLEVEIDHNLRELDLFWNQLEQADPKKQESYVYGSARAKKLLELRLPNWGNQVWENQMHLLVDVLNQQQIDQVLSFYRKLDAITTIKQQLSSMDAERSFAYSSHGNTLDVGDLRLFSLMNEGPAKLTEIEEILKDLQENGNPIKKKVLTA